MDRTPEQEAADTALADAIRQVLHAYQGDRGLLMDYVVVAGEQDLEGLRTVTVIDSGSTSSEWAQLGLLESGAEQLRESMRNPG